MEPVEEVTIVGGGPAGSYCAYQLLSKGINAVIFDNSHPREKPCGGGISPLATIKFPFLSQYASKGSSTSDFRIISTNNQEVITKDNGNSFNISRRILDLGILDMATENGARLIKEKVTAIEKAKGFWKIKTKNRILKTKMIVGADGVRSLVREKTVGPISKENLGLGTGYLVKGAEQEVSTMKFLKGIPGYIWIFPRRDHTSIGIGSELSYGGVLKKLLDEFIQSYCPKVRVLSKFAALLPAIKSQKFYKLKCAGSNWVLIGDAAGHVDPISGEGILYALWSAQLAADAIQKKDPKSFDEHWRKEYGYGLLEKCKQREFFYSQQ